MDASEREAIERELAEEVQARQPEFERRLARPGVREIRLYRDGVAYDVQPVPIVNGVRQPPGTRPADDPPPQPTRPGEAVRAAALQALRRQFALEQQQFAPEQPQPLSPGEPPEPLAAYDLARPPEQAPAPSWSRDYGLVGSPPSPPSTAPPSIAPTRPPPAPEGPTRKPKTPKPARPISLDADGLINVSDDEVRTMLRRLAEKNRPTEGGVANERSLGVLVGSVIPLIALVDMLEDVLGSALVAYPCHDPSGHPDQHRPFPPTPERPEGFDYALCQTQFAAIGWMLVNNFKLDPKWLQRRLHPRPECALCMDRPDSKEAYLAARAWVETGKVSLRE